MNILESINNVLDTRRSVVRMTFDDLEKTLGITLTDSGAGLSSRWWLYQNPSSHQRRWQTKVDFCRREVVFYRV